MDELRTICQKLLEDAHALTVLLCDTQGNVLLSVGEEPDAMGAQRHVAPVTDKFVVAVTFDLGSSLGLVRLRVKKAQELLSPLLSSGSSGSSGSGGSLPPESGGSSSGSPALLGVDKARRAMA